MPSKTKKSQTPEAPNVPAYIVTFSDMVTLLLTFFVMLLSMAQVQDPELFNKARDSFKQYIDCYGLGLLMGKKMVPEFGNNKMKFHIPNPDEDKPARTIDSKDETLRRLFNKVSESMQVMPSEIGVRLTDFLPLHITFDVGQVELDDTAKEYLTKLSKQYQYEIHTASIELYVLGLAPDEPDEKRKWLISSLRAQKVANYLSKEGLKPVYAWGGGAGKGWDDPYSSVPKEAQVLIAVVREN